MFYPEGASVPEQLVTEEFLLRPLKASDVYLDYDAVMTSRAELLLHSMGRWPREDFALEENLADLVRHEREHQERVAFTYTIMNPTETECLGCVYIMPLKPALLRHDISIEGIPDESARVSFWVRHGRLTDYLDKRVLQAMIDWLQTEWVFSKIVFLAMRVQERHIQLYQELGMRLQYPLMNGDLYLPPS